MTAWRLPCWLLTAALCLRATSVAGYTKSDCYFPFLYNGTEYSYCTRNAYHVLWCSLDRVYKGRWAVCGPEVPKKVLDSIRAAVDEVGKEKAKLAQEQSDIDKMAKSVAQLSAANQMAHSNKSAAINALDQRLAALNRSLLQMELEQRNLDHRAANQESLRPLEIGTMILLTVSVITMGVLLYVFHCCSSRKGDGGGPSPSLPETPQLSCLALRRVQPPADSTAESEVAAASTRQVESAKKFPGHFYHLTVDEVDEEAGDEEETEDDDEVDTGDDASSEQHSRAAAALSSAAPPAQQAAGEASRKRGSRFLNR
ncbi:hypothetical protein BOX15_Mlig031717g1 [Macrostomum lignano]|uniref:Fibronectin type-II domain-containing protein n=1 Tax=Macrostomum lignano TaxID=282301 RepID=A0A267F6X6_9PLAT|nr:hypothetical protein BOX15_Mlig031717g1 [Macrostomum lignano]